jgi:hypothetical protein
MSTYLSIICLFIYHLYSICLIYTFIYHNLSERCSNCCPRERKIAVKGGTQMNQWQNVPINKIWLMQCFASEDNTHVCIHTQMHTHTHTHTHTNTHSELGRDSQRLSQSAFSASLQTTIMPIQQGYLTYNLIVSLSGNDSTSTSRLWFPLHQGGCHFICLFIYFFAYSTFSQVKYQGIPLH